jgi:hypothetical protein
MYTPLTLVIKYLYFRMIHNNTYAIFIAFVLWWFWAFLCLWFIPQPIPIWKTGFTERIYVLCTYVLINVRRSLYVLIYIFMYMCMSVRMYVRIYILRCVYVLIYVFTYICKSVRMYLHIYVRRCMCVYIYIYIHIHIYIYIYIYIYIVTLNLEFRINEPCIRFPKCSTRSK